MYVHMQCTYTSADISVHVVEYLFPFNIELVMCAKVFILRAPTGLHYHVRDIGFDYAVLGIEVDH